MDIRDPQNSPCLFGSSPYGISFASSFSPLDGKFVVKRSFLASKPSCGRIKLSMSSLRCHSALPRLLSLLRAHSAILFAMWVAFHCVQLWANPFPNFSWGKQDFSSFHRVLVTRVAHQLPAGCPISSLLSQSEMIHDCSSPIIERARPPRLIILTRLAQRSYSRCNPATRS